VWVFEVSIFNKALAQHTSDTVRFAKDQTIGILKQTCCRDTDTEEPVFGLRRGLASHLSLLSSHHWLWPMSSLSLNFFVLIVFRCLDRQFLGVFFAAGEDTAQISARTKSAWQQHSCRLLIVPNDRRGSGCTTWLRKISSRQNFYFLLHTSRLYKRKAKIYPLAPTWAARRFDNISRLAFARRNVRQ